jgi:hypothetical protein|tara:strand:+ start:259 stop:435 length:177 start_codon:yes stop_codon:yes gene_type:complete
MYIAESWKEGVEYIKNEYNKIGKNASDMTDNEMERIIFRINHTRSTFAIDETGNVIEI